MASGDRIAFDVEPRSHHGLAARAASLPDLIPRRGPGNESRVVRD